MLTLNVVQRTDTSIDVLITKTRVICTTCIDRLLAAIVTILEDPHGVQFSSRSGVTIYLFQLLND